MKLAFLLLHDFRFAGWSLEDFLRRTHFSKEYCKRLSDRGHDVILYMLHQDATSVEIYEQSGFRIKVFPVQFDFPPLPKFGYSHNLQVNKELSLDDPDLIHFNNYYLWSFPYVARWAKQNGKKIVCQYHGACDIFRPVRKMFVPIYQNVDLYLVARDDEIGYLTDSMGIDPSRILKFPNVGVDTGTFKPSLSKSVTPSLLYVGRMPSKAGNLREKSPWLLLEIVANLVKTMPEVEMQLIGDGPGISSLKERAKELGIERNIVFSGYIDNSQLPPLYSRSWITFIPMELDSLDPFWDGSLKESLACSTPVIGFNRNACNPSNAVPNIGYLIPPDSIEGAKMLKILLGDKVSLQKAGEIGRKTVSSCCSWDSVIERLESIYNSLF